MTDEQIVQLINTTRTALHEHAEKLEERLLERIEKTETTLLKEFRKWAVRIEAGMRVNTTSSIGFNERLTVLEERVDDLESQP